MCSLTIFNNLRLMKKTIWRVALAIAMAAAVASVSTGCKKDEPVGPNGGGNNDGPKTVAVTGVSINKASISLTEGTSETLTATVTPDNATNKAVSWKSSDSNIATVDNSGKVTAVKAGSTTITVTTTDGSKTATCTVTVAAKEVEVTGITLDQTSATIVAGDNLVLKATVAPENATDKKVTWSSSDASIATVDENGKVTAVSAGNADITATAGSFSAACALTVQAKVIPVTSVNVDNWSITMLAGETVSLKVTVLPEDATNKNITFQSENTEVAAVDSEGTILAIGAGSTKVIVTSEDGGLTSNCMVTVVSETGEMEVDGIFYRNYYMRSLEVIANPDENVKYSGNIKIPGKITYNGIEYTVDRVGDRAFLGCESLISVELAEGFRVIGPYGFAGCENLEKITLPASLESIDWANQVFAFCPKLEIVVSEKNPLFFINDGALYWKDPSYGIALRWLPEKKTGTFSIMEGTGAIRSYALFHTSIDKIIIPTSIVFIFERFFCGECKTPLEIVLNWSTASEINNIYKAYDDPSPFYFNTTDRSKITVSVPKGTKPFYSAHWLWGACGSIVER